jgi:hypothetical protein
MIRTYMNKLAKQNKTEKRVAVFNYRVLEM